jgi:hypothetical protein
MVAYMTNYYKLLTWIIMDGTLVDDAKYHPNKKTKRIQFKLSKKRKIYTLTTLLNDLGIDFTIKKATMSKYNKLQPYMIRIYRQPAIDLYTALEGRKEFNHMWLDTLNYNELKSILEATSVTDGTPHGNQTYWTTTNYNDVVFMQKACELFKVNFKIICKVDKQSGFTKNCKQQYLCAFPLPKFL